MTLTIASIFDKNDDFIRLQYNSIKCFVKDEFRYIVINNGSTSERRESIERTCSFLGIEWINVYTDYDATSSQIHAAALNTAWEKHLSNLSGVVLSLDSDMFFIKDITFGDDFDVCYIPQYRNENKIKYMWAGLFMLNMGTINKEINFSTACISETYCDSGGSTYYFLNGAKYKTKYMRFSHIADILPENRLLVDINGCTGLVAVDGGNKPVKIFPHEKRKSKLYDEFAEHVSIIEKYNFPKPYIFDLVKMEGNKKNFIFHFKNSNWGSQYTPNHITEKKTSLVRMLSDLGVDIG